MTRTQILETSPVPLPSPPAPPRGVPSETRYPTADRLVESGPSSVPHRQRHHVTRVFDQDPAYPANLRPVDGHPHVLYLDGTIIEADERAVAVVGSRSASPRGVREAFVLGRELALAGVTVVSGLAAGIDTAAHRGALSVGGRTIAVLGTGLDRVYPRENIGLAEEIRSRGALVSQFPLGTQPSKRTFPIRNAVISGLSRASIVVEASANSGTRVEIGFSLQQNRPVLLWAPTMEECGWARDLALEHRAVEFVSTVTDIVTRIDNP